MAVALIIAIVLILVLPRKYVIVPLLLATFLIPASQVVVLSGLHLPVTRILAVFGCVRLVSSTRLFQTGVFPGGFNPVNVVVTLWAIFSVLTYSLLYMEMQALINQLGHLLDVLGGYFVLRWLIRDREDVRRVIKVFAFIALVMAIFMTREHLTGQNIFWQGTSSGTSAVRNGSVRAMGALEVYLLAGAFGATLLPLLVWLWCNGKSKVVASLGMVGATAMVITSSSSTSILSYVAGIIGLCFWPFRKRMRLIRWGIVITLVGLHLVMKAPVWHLISRVDLTGASSSYQRYMLVDTCIRHFSDWWLLGAKDYGNWGWDMWDTSNAYVSAAVTGGLATLVTFVLIISCSFGRLGRARKLVQGSPYEWSLWCLCAALFAHVMGYIGVGYDRQMQIAWYALLAIISVATCEAKELAVARVNTPATLTSLQFLTQPEPSFTLGIQDQHMARLKSKVLFSECTGG